MGSVLLNYFFGTMIMTVLEQERMMKLVMFMLSIGNVSNLWVFKSSIFKSLKINK